ncbi:MAG: hypothetical protein WCD47_18525 [Candidatus Sulfotelmatobacter sp.]
MPVTTKRLAIALLSRLLVLALPDGLVHGQNAQPEGRMGPPTAEDIMARVAANQDRSDVLRKEYVYKQHIHVTMNKPKSRMVREETADYDVIPLPDGTQKQLKSLTGRYWSKGKYVAFQGEQVPEADSIDAVLIHSIRNDLTDDKSKDGLARHLFPLTSEEQKDYEFKLLGQEVEAGRNVYHITFTPRGKKEFGWAGEALIDVAEFQPVRVSTKVSRRIPFSVRTMLGTDLPGVGFNVVYKRHEDGVWFPSSFGTEFGLRVLFFLNRDIAISLENSGFEHTGHYPAHCSAEFGLSSPRVSAVFSEDAESGRPVQLPTAPLYVTAAPGLGLSPQLQNPSAGRLIGNGPGLQGRGRRLIHAHRRSHPNCAAIVVGE